MERLSKTPSKKTTEDTAANRDTEKETTEGNLGARQENILGPTTPGEAVRFEATHAEVLARRGVVESVESSK
jgi:hypothetical protein